MVSCVAVLAIRNEEHHARRLLNDLTCQGIDVFVIDHGSSDATLDVCNGYHGNGVVGIQHQAWEGTFNLTEQLDLKQQTINSLNHDWVIHIDADEWLQSPQPNESLLDGISRLAKQGYNVINFEEFVFLPDSTFNPTTAQNIDQILNYYYFAPKPNRLMRAWKNRSGLMLNPKSGGHRISGDLRVAPENFVLRHYICLSQVHAIEKYSSRVFSAEDTNKGWHRNRLDLTPDKLKLPSGRFLNRLEYFTSREFDKSNPQHFHYWDWDRNGSTCNTER